MKHETDQFTRAYIECALWSSTDENGENLEGNELADETISRMVEDCKDFQESFADLLERWYEVGQETPERAGHDFWLTRNRHGAGFWDRYMADEPRQIGKELTDMAHAYGSCDLYVGDDGKVYAQ